MPRLFNDFGIIISATSAQELIIRRQMCEPRDMKRVWFDLAVPRDIESTCAELGIEVLCVDDLQQVIEENRSHKKHQAHQAHALVGTAVVEYFHWIQSLDVLPLIKSMRLQANQASMQEVARAIKKGYLPAQYEKECLGFCTMPLMCFCIIPHLISKSYLTIKRVIPLSKHCKKSLRKMTSPSS